MRSNRLATAAVALGSLLLGSAAVGVTQAADDLPASSRPAAGHHGSCPGDHDGDRPRVEPGV